MINDIKDNVIIRIRLRKKLESSWDKVNGFYVANGETYLGTIDQDPMKNPLAGIQSTWFTWFSYKKRYMQPNSVMETNQRFATQLLSKPDTQEAAPSRTG